MKSPQEVMSAQQFDALFQSVCNWGLWGGDDQRGTLNYITPAMCARCRRTGSLGPHRFHGRTYQQGGWA